MPLGTSPSAASTVLAQIAAPSRGGGGLPMGLGAAEWVILLLVAASLVAGWWWRRRRRLAATADPSCGRCGYLVKGLTTFTCPECGSDLREVGIVGGGRAATPPGAAPGPSAVFFRVVGWKLLVVAAAYAIPAAYAVDYFDDHVRPITVKHSEVIRLAPHSRQYAAVTVTLDEQYTTRGHSRARTDVARREATVELEKGPTRATFKHDALAGANTFRDAKGNAQRTTAPLAQELRTWARDYGVDVDNAAVDRELDLIATAIAYSDRPSTFWDSLANRSDRLFNRQSAAHYTDPVGSVPWTTLATAAAVLVGLALLAIVWRLNRAALHRGLAASAASGPSHDIPTTPSPGGPSLAPAVRTLTVMFSDVKDYTARTANESRLGVLDLVRRHRDLVAPVASRRGGRIVKSLGDGLLLTFDSATDAALAGLEIQAAAAAHARQAFADRDKLDLRVAVSTGEVTVDRDGDVFGDAVNLASRAQQHAAAGDVLMTEPTAAMVNRREVGVADAGTFELKGVGGAVKLYRAVSRAGAVAARTAHDSSEGVARG